MQTPFFEYYSVHLFPFLSRGSRKDVSERHLLSNFEEPFTGRLQVHREIPGGILPCGVPARARALRRKHNAEMLGERVVFVIR